MAACSHMQVCRQPNKSNDFDFVSVQALLDRRRRILPRLAGAEGASAVEFALVSKDPGRYCWHECSVKLKDGGMFAIRMRDVP